MLRFFTSLFVGITAIIGTIIHPLSAPSQITSTYSLQTVSHQATQQSSQQVYTQSELLAMASNIYANGVLPLGDSKYTTANPQVGYIYLCNVMGGAGGAKETGSWIGTNTWSINEKPSVLGHVSWPNATFSMTTSGENRIISGNDLPVGTTTGIFPISSSDPAYKYDQNPNSIEAHQFTDTLPLNPTYSDTPYCMGGEVGIMLNGVPLFNGFDAEMRDAPAHELQDSCNGHPQENGEYHYHSLSSCITNVDETHVIGFALDGFPITGSEVATGKYLTTANLDVCHGITSQIMLDGKVTTTYHYVMTEDFPYSASCFRGKPISLQVIQGQNGQGGGNQSPQQAGGQIQQGGTTNGNQTKPQPPQQAFTVCSGQVVNAPCQFISPRGAVNGICQTPPNQTNLVCIPSRSPSN